MTYCGKEDLLRKKIWADFVQRDLLPANYESCWQWTDEMQVLAGKFRKQHSRWKPFAMSDAIGWFKQQWWFRCIRLPICFTQLKHSILWISVAAELLERKFDVPAAIEPFLLLRKSLPPETDTSWRNVEICEVTVPWRLFQEPLASGETPEFHSCGRLL